jgi:glucuronate isomerase
MALSDNPFIHDDFLLGNSAARELFHGFAKCQPIIDFHNHLSPALIAKNHQFLDLQEIWLAGDHYKWRALRSNGIPEFQITGAASAEEKFHAWASTVPYTLRNPLYHWTHLELARHFGITEPLNQETAPRIWHEANAKLDSLRVHDLLAMHDVRVLCTTDDPADPLDDHSTIAKSNLPTRVFPTYRPDKAFLISDPAMFRAWLEKLESVTGSSIRSFDDLLSALKCRHDDFHAIGARLSDHGLNTAPKRPPGHAVASAIFTKAFEGTVCSPEEQADYEAQIMHEVARWNAARGWTMQLHLGALRNNSSRTLRSLGADAGCDSIADHSHAAALAGFLDALDNIGELPRTILYNLNPSDNYVFGTMIGNFQDGSIPGKIQLGSGWWFLDQKEGMEAQLNALSNLGLLRRFVGMVTDSRSFLSFTRHEYFRRVLCNMLGRDIESGELPDDIPLIGSMIREICFENARNYFGFEMPDSRPS